MSEVGGPVVLDGGDRRCVQLLIELRRLVDDLSPGTVVHLVATDPAAPIDLPAWCHLTGHAYLGPVPGCDRPAYAVRVEADARATWAQAPWHVADR
ncbi:sulfurtransferase TusA family protein [Sphaerimonospora cavernae]|uniref:Sulfurtransferase TusA family protein n=1 Tax=Sphaerimonospora cavernae TaxID=1740611 RepID=A0ABV6U730_9ACTN